ncbi:MAG: hypothetical protein R3336_04860 [Phycisphaeraceae bacterium]|nr:hypothetical protein [Phycisphaeraceae bacterium]
MAESSNASSADGFLQRHHFLLRRLHSLSGIVPVGIFVIFHLFTNMQLALGGDVFQHEVDFIHDLPALLFMEIGLWGGIGFHAALGLVYTFQGGGPNNTKYRHADNWRYTLQRVTGILALIFIFLHIATLRWRWDLFGWFTPFYARVDGAPTAASTTAMALQAHWLVVVLYVVGVASVVYHWANGLWTAALTWGLTLSETAMKRWGYCCAGLGIFLAVAGAGGIYGALTHEVTEADRTMIQQIEAGELDPHHSHGATPAVEPESPNSHDH